MRYAFPLSVKCTECASDIDLDRDPFCYVVPHRGKYHYLHSTHIPMCRVCRVADGYDVVTSYKHLKTTKYSQPLPLLLEYKPEVNPKVEAEVTNIIEHQTEEGIDLMQVTS